MIRQEIRTLADQEMFPGKYLFTWIKVSKWLPWMLSSIEPLPAPEPFAA